MNDNYASLLSFLFFMMRVLGILAIPVIFFYIPYRDRKIKKKIPPANTYTQANQTGALNEEMLCPHCHGKKLVRGEFYRYGSKRSMPAELEFNSIEFYDKSDLRIKPKHPTIYRLKETYFNCCAECGYVSTTADTAKVDEILSIYAKPELLRRLGIDKLK